MQTVLKNHPTTTTACALCGRHQPLTFHHLIPRAMHNKKRFQKRYAKTELRTRGIDICRLCHDGIHALLTAKELAESYPTTELLLAHDGLAKHLAWVKKQK